ncbi:MAG: DUF4173 domain-containing protein [Amylibacter sp.]|jgi:hypothetical protein|nr:DUF4173 domain-containing protein [Amylibacter sp.]
MSQHTIDGIPRALIIDGWWMSADAQLEAPDRRIQAQEIWAHKAKRRLLSLLALLGLADVLFFQHAMGLSIAIFGVAVFIASVLESGTARPKAGPMCAVVLGVLPVIEYLQFFSVVFAIFGVIVGIAWHRVGGAQSLAGVLFGARRLLLFLPIGAVQSFDAWVKAPVGVVDLNGVFRDFVRNWAFPIGGGCLILGLLVMANPVLERVLDDLLDVEFDLQKLIYRILFWMGAAFILWPFLAVTLPRLQRPFGPQRVARLRGWGLNAQSVSNALWVFNGLLCVQLVMDSSFAVSGALPYDMSYAKYAHRGAYPLVVTALLAGCFALAARPFLDEGRFLKPLMIVWLGLNALLTLSSMYRLGLYVDAYGLTYLRVRAGIWMVLVAAWLGLIAWQIICSKANGWLLARSFGMGIGTIYVGCFVNFAEVIASHNEGHPRFQTTTKHQFCHLTKTSKTAVDITSKWYGCSSNYEKAQIDGWRDWGFREWRVARYVESIQAKGAGHENLGR